MNYLYFAPNTKRTAFKIGFTITPKSRLNSVVGKISYTKTYVFACNNAKAVEDFCHKYFKDFRVEEYKEGDGHSEWYDISIFKVAKNKVIEHLEMLEISSHFNYYDQFTEPKPRKRKVNKKKRPFNPVCEVHKNSPYPYAFTKLPESIQLSKPKDYRHVDYGYAGMKCKEWGITSARQYRAFWRAFNPAGFPSNPDIVYKDLWSTWDEFLQCDICGEYAGTSKAAVKKDELMPYEEARIWIAAQQFQTIAEYQTAFDEGQFPIGIPRQPQVRYENFYALTDDQQYKKGWKYFLGKRGTPVIPQPRR